LFPVFTSAPALRRPKARIIRAERSEIACGDELNGQAMVGM
jgi:hypothetical protein